MKSKSRILVISHNAFSEVYNNGKTLESLFGGIEKDNLAQLFFSQNEEPDFSYCAKYYHITDKNVLFNIFRFNSTCGSIVNESLYYANKNSIKHKDILFDIAKSQSQNLVFIRDLVWKTRSWNTVALRNWCADFAPDVVFFVGGGAGFSHEIACYISAYLSKPLVTYFTDDYLIYPKTKNILDVIQRWRMKRFYRKTIEQSSLLFVIGNLMAHEYKKYFNKHFCAIMNAAPVMQYIPQCHNETLSLSYFGGLHLMRWKMIVRLARALEGGCINVYSIVQPSNEVMQEFHRAGVVYKGGVTGGGLQKAIMETDILLHVESDDDFYRSLTRLSISTKIPEYLMSGRFVLGYGPEEVASMRLLSDNNIGIVIPSSVSDAELKIKLCDIMNNKSMRHQVGYRGYEYAVNNFDHKKIVKDFTLKLESLI